MRGFFGDSRTWLRRSPTSVFVVWPNLGGESAMRRRFNVSVPRARAFREKHPRVDTVPSDDRSSKNQPKRVENGRDRSL
jgi:hypothetical protein